LIECVPNVSEGRNPAVVGELADAVASGGCRVLDLHLDADHNRSVLTFVGTEDALFAGVLALAKAAVPRIDLRRQRGVHPRMGAVDVVPFVPLEGASMSECVRLARRVGQAIGEELGIPVLLYEAAATSEARRNLAALRRGQFEGLGSKLARPEWAPDFGPRRPHPSAGVTAVGARDFLVAFNVVLGTSNLAIARQIAKTIREAAGGMKGVKALGLPLASRELVQVSMNLTDVAATNLPEAYDRVEQEAQALGVSVIESEIVGLVPCSAVGGATTATLRLDRDLESVVLENRLAGPSR
jgi:glutamate formiminotransferase